MVLFIQSYFQNSDGTIRAIKELQFQSPHAQGIPPEDSLEIRNPCRGVVRNGGDLEQYGTMRLFEWPYPPTAGERHGPIGTSTN